MTGSKKLVVCKVRLNSEVYLIVQHLSTLPVSYKNKETEDRRATLQSEHAKIGKCCVVSQLA